MEVTRGRLLVLSGLLGALGVMNVVKTRPWAPQRTERWMEASLPTEVAGLKMRPGRDNPRQSYRAAESTYRMLKPYGIVCRTFGTRRLAFDAVVVAGSSLDAFHDPNVCFPVNGWPIVKAHPARVRTRAYGEVPVTVLSLKAPDGVHRVAFCFRGSGGFRASLGELRWDWFKGALASDRAQEGAIYRFVQLRGPDSETAVLAFAGAFLDGAAVESNGAL